MKTTPIRLQVTSSPKCLVYIKHFFKMPLNFSDLAKFKCSLFTSNLINSPSIFSHRIIFCHHHHCKWSGKKSVFSLSTPPHFPLHSLANYQLCPEYSLWWSQIFLLHKWSLTYDAMTWWFFNFKLVLKPFTFHRNRTSNFEFWSDIIQSCNHSYYAAMQSGEAIHVHCVASSEVEYPGVLSRVIDITWR